MSEQPLSLNEIVQRLPPEAQAEVRDFAELLLDRKARRPSDPPSFDWAGALEDMKSQFTSVELQHRISAWRAGEP